MTEYTISDKVRAWAAAHNYDPELHLEYFQDVLANKSGKAYRDLDAAFRNCLRADWGGLRFKAECAARTKGATTAWWTSQSGMAAEASRRGVSPARPGESDVQFRARIEAARAA